MVDEDGYGSRRTWLITGASRGLGRAFAEAALLAGDAVVLTAREPRALADLALRNPDRALALALDVTDRAAASSRIHSGGSARDRTPMARIVVLF